MHRMTRKIFLLVKFSLIIQNSNTQILKRHINPTLPKKVIFTNTVFQMYILIFGKLIYMWIIVGHSCCCLLFSKLSSWNGYDRYFCFMLFFLLKEPVVQTIKEKISRCISLQVSHSQPPPSICLLTPQRCWPGPSPDASLETKMGCFTDLLLFLFN